MKEERKPIEISITVLKKNLNLIATIQEWAEFMCYENSKLFSRHFIRYFHATPIKVLIEVRIKSIIKELKRNSYTCRQIASHHSLPDEKALNSFMKRHLGKPPTRIRNMSKEDSLKLMEKKRSNIKE
ncbi:MAG: helix-turn-helix transcriptional regulator [Balneolaceae bacterium]|nr:helix-turn-helix transcriptional regulator [Balneolaceae bacterium]